MGDTSYSIAEWTLSIELYASFFIYLIAYTVVNYRWRFAVYVFICCFIYLPQAFDGYLLTEYNVPKFILHFPMFIIGTFLADLETIKPAAYRLLNIFRDLPWYFAILRNLVLLTVFFCFGSYPGESVCKE